MAGLADLSRLGVEWELPNGQSGVRFVEMTGVMDEPGHYKLSWMFPG